MVTRNAIPAALHSLASMQSGTLTTRQIHQHGVSRRRRTQLIDDGLWTPIDYGVTYTGTGTIPWNAYVWSAYLCAGADAMVAGYTAAHLYGLTDGEDLPIEIFVPRHRAPRARSFARYRRVDPSVRRGQTRHHLLCTSVADTVIDLCARNSRSQAIDLITKSLQRRLTSAHALKAATARRTRLSNRQLIDAIVTDAERGIDSALEMLFLHDVERAHGLPKPFRQVVASPKGGRVDIHFREYGLVVELDGRETHVGREFRDRERDNRNARSGLTTLRYGWHEIGADPCAIAAEIIAILVARGWRGEMTRCRRCPNSSH